MIVIGGWLHLTALMREFTLMRVSLVLYYCVYLYILFVLLSNEFLTFGLAMTLMSAICVQDGDEEAYCVDNQERASSVPRGRVPEVV